MMEGVIELSENIKRKYLVIIEDEKTILSTIIKENFYFLLRKNKINFLIFETNKEDGSFFIEKYHIKEFPSILFFNNNRLIHHSKGFSYQEIMSVCET